MRKSLSFLFLLGVLAVFSASAQTLYQEGRFSVLSTTPAVLAVPDYAFANHLNASYTARLTDRFDLTGMAGYGSRAVAAGAAAGYTYRFAESRWGVRAGVAVSTSTEVNGARQTFGTGGVSAMLFREVGNSESLLVVPFIRMGPELQFGEGDPVLGMTSSLGLPVFYRTWREVRLFVSPTYRPGDNVFVSMGAQVSF